LFCNGISLMFLFNGLSYTTNALFNNLGVAHYATVMNFLKATVGTIPFVYFGIQWGGAEGAFWGMFVGSAVMGIAGWLLAIRLLKKLNCHS
jgi:Na+-driven multidrug efflux pump